MRIVLPIILAAGLFLTLAGCPSASDVASSVVSAGADPVVDTGGSANVVTQDAGDPAAQASDGADPTLGACCLGGSCVQMTAEACYAAGGAFLGVGLSCDSSPCADAILLGQDSDGDGCTDLDELRAGTNPYQPGDCGDIDQDGIPNEQDADVDGDHIPNALDSDIDGDGQLNDDDPDPDGDGKIGSEDPDEDGDFICDRWDLDDDGDGQPDDEDPDEKNNADDDGEGDSDEQLDLFERLRTGKLTEADRDAIAGEIVKRLDSPTDKERIKATLVDVVTQALKPDRQAPPTTAAVGVNAIDVVYEQLKEAIELGRSQQPHPNRPLEQDRFPGVLKDFMARASSLVNMAKAFPSLSIDEIGKTVSGMRQGLDEKRLEDVSELMGAFISTKSIGQPEEERKELGLLSRGTATLGGPFAEADALDLLVVSDTLRQRVDRKGGTDEEKDAHYGALLDRMKEVSKDKPSIHDALDQVEQEDDAAP